MKFANLHLHSTYSDGGFTPSQLVLIGKSLGYSALALTDHETDGGCREFMKHAKNEGIQSVSGCEFYGKEDGVTLHLTALDFDQENAPLRAYIKERVDGYNEYTRLCVEYGIQNGFIDGITWNDVTDIAKDGAWICIDTVLLTMNIKKAIPDNFTEQEFRKNVFKVPELMAKKHKTPPAEKVIRLVRDAGGVIALAHPYKQTHFVQKLVSYGLNGIEVSHPDLYENSAYLALEAAETFNLYKCGGTDHTGAMSCCGGRLAIPALQGITEEEFTILKERRL
ncbi:MAG: PHP domain-containing protein [Clostridia bacterium]|nr:PHP domain-containing protein [Clostridia bacterium]